MRFTFSSSLLTATAAAACTTAPPLHRPFANVETVPAGAHCVTSDGFEFTTPATVPLRGDGILRFEIDLEGYEPRRVELNCEDSKSQSVLGALALCTIAPVFFSPEPWERVEARDGHLTLRLIPTPAANPSTVEQ